MTTKKDKSSRRQFISTSLPVIASASALSLSGAKAVAFEREGGSAKVAQTKKIGIIICARYQTCGGGKCLRSIQERVGGFARYPDDVALQLVGFGQCGGCPGGNVQTVPQEMVKNGAEVIHLATGLVVGYPPCPETRYFKEYIESRYDIPVVIGTHPIPMSYLEAHKDISSYKTMAELAPYLMEEDPKIMIDYN
jgi:predicted metal-binding protein